MEEPSSRGVGDVMRDEGPFRFGKDTLHLRQMQNAENPFIVHDQPGEIAENARFAAAHRLD